MIKKINLNFGELGSIVAQRVSIRPDKVARGMGMADAVTTVSITLLSPPQSPNFPSPKKSYS